MKKEIFIEAICYAFFFLFIYTAISKWLIYPIFLNDLHRSPFIGGLALFISLAIPTAELATASLLVIRQTRRVGLYASLFLMALFTLYVAGVLTLTDNLPCNCGGIIRNLSWKNHLLLNSSLVILALIGILLSRNHRPSQFASR